MENKYILKTDGGSRGNPGHCAIAYICYKNGEEFFKNSKYLGQGTNNFAEYTALIEGLKESSEKGVLDLECISDSELMVKQLNGQYKVRDINIAILYKQVEDLRNKFNKIKFIHTRRDGNKEADKLVNDCLDANT